MHSILIAENFLSLDEVDRYTQFAKSTDRWEPVNDKNWNERSLNLSSMPEDIREPLLDYRIRVKQRIQEHFAAHDTLYADIFQFVRWREGDGLDPAHADAEHLDGSPHPYAYRNFAAITYLNTDYQGGRISFPNHDDFCPELKPGMLVAFPGTLDYLHRVTKITQGVRYTIAGFFTFDQEHKDAYRI